MAKVFKVTPKRIKRSNVLVLTPDMSVIVTTQQHMTSPFSNGAKELKEIYNTHTLRQAYYKVK